MKKILLLAALLFCAALLISPNAWATSIIDFESVPGVDTLAPGVEISTQFEAEYGVTFSTNEEGTEFPVLAKVGDSELVAFYSSNGANAVSAEDNEMVGQYFIVTDQAVGEPVDLIITYTTPVQTASGLILDLEGTYQESFTITARGEDGNPLPNGGTKEYTDPAPTGADYESGDGRATEWYFSFLKPVIKSIKLHSERPRSNVVGFAFDAFSSGSLQLADGDCDCCQDKTCPQNLAAQSYWYESEPSFSGIKGISMQVVVRNNGDREMNFSNYPEDTLQLWSTNATGDYVPYELEYIFNSAPSGTVAVGGTFSYDLTVDLSSAPPEVAGLAFRPVDGNFGTMRPSVGVVESAMFNCN